jgi:hypothetical protein
MTLPETLYKKNVINKHSFPMVNHTAYFNTRFGVYGLLKSGYDAGLFWIEHMCEWFSGLRPKKCESWWGFVTHLQPACSAFRRLFIHTVSITTTMVTAVQRQHSCGALAECRKSKSSTVSNLAMITIVKIVILFIGLGSLMACTHDLTILTKRKCCQIYMAYV